MDVPSFGVLTINTGSSSLKAAVFRIGPKEERLVDAEARQIGLESSRIVITGRAGEKLLEKELPLPDHRAALQEVFGWLRDNELTHGLAAIGHRIVHGGRKYTRPARVDAALLAELRRLVPLAPEHLPQAIAAIDKTEESLPGVPQIACFDTAFHATMPRRAKMFALPRALADEGIVRFGFHGLSYEFLVERLRSVDPAHCGGRAVLAHLGNGASMAAVLEGKSIDTSMGFTPAGGIVMGTRSGDLDPGVLVYLAETQKLTPAALNRLVNQQAGLLGVSSISADMRILLERRGEAAAADAIETFCYQARKFLGAYAAALGGLDTLVFAGGIGERSPEIREQICAGLGFLGIRLEPERNAAGTAVISSDEGSVVVRVIETDEDLMIARHSYRLLADKED